MPRQFVMRSEINNGLIFFWLMQPQSICFFYLEILCEDFPLQIIKWSRAKSWGIEYFHFKYFCCYFNWYFFFMENYVMVSMFRNIPLHFFSYIVFFFNFCAKVLSSKVTCKNVKICAYCVLHTGWFGFISRAPTSRLSCCEN